MRNKSLPGRHQISLTQPQLSRRKLYAAMLIASQCMVAGQLWAAPEGGVVVGGEGVITQAGVDTMIHQATERMAIDWRSFDVAANERVEFIQPSSSSIALNRVLGNRGSEILGRIDANGQVMLVNPNGVVFGKNSIVNVGGMIASGLSIDPTSFINGDFALNSIDGAEGKVINYGIINAATGGSVTLVGEQVQNDGLISAKLGTVNLAAGNAAVLTFDSSGMVGVRVTEAIVQSELGVDAAVINNGSINAEGGRVLLSAGVSEDIFSNAVNNGGMNKESSVVMHEDGSFTLGAGADVINTGDISVSTTEGNAGQVVALGENITHSGSISANTSKGTGGSVELHSADTTLLTENSTVSAQASVQGKGGDVKVLGNKVGLFDQAEVNASGANGGGRVLIGGDKTGDNKNIRNADFIYLGEDTNVKTDALIDGNGGKLITFASDTARIYGNLYSRGGSEGGNGGFIETSGLKGFEILNTPDITAVAGTGGTWLIDPFSIVISENSSNINTNGTPFTSTGTATLRNETLTAALTNGSRVIVQTGGTAGDNQGNGDITISNRIRFNINNGANGDGSATLRLLAHNNINVNAAIERDNDTRTDNNDNNTGRGILNLELIANKDNRGGANGNTLDGANGGNIKIENGVTIATNGGYFYAGKSAQEVNGRLGSDYTDKVFNFESLGTISTYGNLGGGDIVINATNNVSLGVLAFGYDYLQANSYSNNDITNALVRVGSVTVNSGGDVTLNGAINFNNTGKRQGGGGNGFAVSPAPDTEETFLKIDAFGDITINGLISDVGYGDARDSLNIELTADKNNTSGDRGDITIANHIYTAGGNFTASGFSFTSSGWVINTDRANAQENSTTTETLANGRIRGIENGNAQRSNGGDVTISAVSTVSLGSIVTDAEAISGTPTGNLVIQVVDQSVAGISNSNLVVSQDGLLKIAGTSTFNVGTGTNSKIELLNANNEFTGNLIFKSSNTVKLSNTEAITLGDSFVSGLLELKGDGITQAANTRVEVGTTTTLEANDKEIILTNENNNFGGFVKATNTASLSLLDINDLTVDELTTTGAIDLTSGSTNKIVLTKNLDNSAGTDKNITFNSNVEIAGSDVKVDAGTGAINFNGTTNSDNATAKNLTLVGKDITFKGNIGSDVGRALDAVSIASTGYVTIDAASINASSFAIIGSGLSADSFTLSNGKNSWAVNNTNAGTVQKFDADNNPLSPVITFSGIQNVTGGSGVDTFDISQNIQGNVNGGDGSDIFNIDVLHLDASVNGGNGNDVFNINVATTKANLNGDGGNDIFNVKSIDKVIATLDGGDDSDTINAADRANKWLLGDDEKLNDDLAFSNIENVNGNSGKDSFKIVGDRAVTGTINADGTDGAINNENDEVTFDTDATINLSSASFSFFNVLNAEVLASQNRGQLTVLSNSGDTINWSLDDKTVAKNNGGTIKFSNFTSYLGGEGNDTFFTKNTTPLTGLVNGAGGNNIFDVSLLSAATANSIVVGDTFQADSFATLKEIQLIKGNGLTSLQLTSGINTWEISASRVGNVGAINFTGVSNIVGASQSDSIKTSINSNATWSITGTNNGKLLVNDPLEEVIAFSNIGNLIGSGLNDTFSFFTGSSVVSAEGNGGNDTADLSQLAARTITVGASTGFAFSGIEQLKADFSKEFVLITETGEAWDIDGVDSGTVAGTKFIGFKNLQGSTADDTFNITAAFTGVINAGAGNDSFVFSGTGSVLNASGGSGAGTDTVDLRSLNGDRNITLDGNKINGVSDIERVVVDANNNNTLAANGTNTWDIYDVDGNAATTHDGKVAGMEFIGFKNLTGGAGANAGIDTFNINNNFDGAISGGDGADIFNINAVVTNLQGGAGSDSFVFYGTGSVITANGGSSADIDIVDLRNLSGVQDIILNGTPIRGVSDIERVVAKVDNNNKLTAYGTNTWDIEELDGNTATTYDVKVAGVEFIGFKTLAGGTGANAGDDTFNINNNFDGTISGGDGADTFKIKANVTNINGGADADVFNIEAVVTNLQGGAGNDSFVFYDAGSVGIGSSGGVGGVDVIDLRNLSEAQNITLDGNNIKRISNIERAVANADKNNTLTANGANTWDIGELDGNESTTHDVKVAGIEFIGFKNLTGGSGAYAGVDTFNINNNFDGTISGGDGADTFNIKANVTTISGGDGADTFNIEAQVGNINGGNGADTFTFYESGSIATGGIADAGTDAAIDSVDLSKLLNGVTVNISGSTVYGIANIERVKADGNKSFTFAASDTPNAWTIEVANGIDGKLNQLEFVGFKALQGGTGVDSFDIKTNFAGAINDKGGADNFAINAAFSGSLDGGADADTFTISAAITGDLLGGAGDDKFIFNNAGSVMPAQGKTAVGGDGFDIVNLSGVNADKTIALNDSAIYGLVGIERVIGNGNWNFTLDASATTHPLEWLIGDIDGAGPEDGVNDGRVQNIEFINFRTLLGSSGNDKFTFNKDFTGTVEGSGGNDEFIFNSGFSGTVISLGGDDLFAINNIITGSLQGGSGADRFVFSGIGSIAANGSADASDGADIVDLSKIEDDLEVELTGGNTLYGVSHVERILGNKDYNFTLSTNIFGTTWEIYDFDGDGILSDGVNDGKVANIEFIDFKNLQGSNGADTFNLQSDFAGVIRGAGGDDTFNIRTAINGTLLGENGSDTYRFFNSGSVASSGNSNAGTDGNMDRADFSNITDGATVSVSGSLIENIAGIERLVGSATKQFTLSAASVPNTWKITNTDGGQTLDDGVNDGFINGIQFINFKKLLGGSGADEFTFEGANASVESIDGGLGVNTLQGRNALNTWQITNDNAGTLAANGSVYTTFGRIQNLVGGTLADIFNINAVITNVSGGNGDDRFIFDSINNTGKASSINGGDGENELVGRDTNNTWTTSGDNAGTILVTDGQVYVTGFSGIQRLIGGDGADVFNLNHRISGGVQAGDGTNRFNVNTTVGHLIGGAGDDQFVFGAQGDAQSVNGGSGNANSLTGRNAENTWTITSANAGSISSNSNEYLDSFSNIQILNGGIGDDTFNINAAAGSIFGHAGNDLFSFAANNNGVAALIDGGAGGDTLRGRTQTSTWTMTGANAGSVSAGGTSYTAAFIGIETLGGQAGSDILAAINQANAWSITDENRGSLRAATTGASAISFEGMENLLGSEGIDSFVFETNAAKITGFIDGGSSVTKNVVKDLLDLTRLTGNLTVNLGAFQNNVLNVSNIETITASASNVGNHVIQGASDAAYRWNIDGQDKGVIERVINPLLETSVSFVNFGDLRGGSGSDRFDVQGTISNSIDGGEGDDLVDYSKRLEDVVITLGGNGGLGITGINSIEGVVGNSSTGNGFTSTIQVASGYNTWKIDGENDGSILINNKKIIFENFTDLIGGDGNDTFELAESGRWIGTIDGGGGENIIDSMLSTINQKFVVDELNPTGETSLKNIDEIKGNASTGSTLASRSRANTWQIYNNEGRLNGDIKFTGIANLEGGAFVDNFIISSLSSLASIDGGGGDDIANLGSISESIRVAADSQTSADINLINIETINANNNVSNTLLGGAAGNEWTINALNAGVLNKTINFAGFANITGSSAADNVAFINSAANLTGHIDLAEGSDSLDLTAANRGITVQLNSSRVGLPSGVLSVDNIESINGAAGQQNRLISDNFANTWTLNNINAGQISSSEKSPVLFYEFANLNGGSNDDTFNFEASGNVTGLLNGGGHIARDLVDLSKSSIADVVIATPSDVAGFTNVEKYIGNNIDSSITAANVDNNWSLSGTNRGVLNGVVEFENFGVLKGGNKQDYFALNQARISGSIDSGDGDDAFNIQESTITGNIQAGKGNDNFEFIITPGLAGTANIDGGEGTNRLIVNGGDATYKVSHQIGSAEYTDGSNNTYSILYSGLNNILDDVVANSLSIFGTAAANTFRLQTGRYSIDNNNQISYTNKANLVINGLAGDKAVIDGVVDVAGGITLNNLDVFAENGGMLRAQSLELVSTGEVGSSTNRLKTTISDLSLNGTNGDIYLEEQDALNLKGFNVSSTDLVDFNIGGNLSSTNPLVYTGTLNVASARGSIQLGSNNLLSGLLNFEAAQDISLGNIQALTIGNLAAQNVNLSSGTSITGSGIFSALGLTTLNATTDIALANSENNFNQLAITNAGNVSIYDKNGLTTVGVSVANNADLRSAGNIIIGAACGIECANNYGIKAGSLKIQSDATVSISKNIVAVESSDIQAQGISINDAITSKKINLNSGNGRLLLNETGGLLSQGGGSIELAAGSIEQHSSVVSDGNIKAAAVGDIVMMSRASIESQDGDVELSSNNLQLATVKAVEGSVIMNAKGAIADNNLDETNIIASAWRADAANGIGVEGADAIETDVGRLSVRNLGHIAGTKSSINIANMNSVVIEQLINNGNILFSNANGDVILDNTSNLEFDITKTSAIEQGGIINANTGINGGVLTLSINGGSVRAINKANKANPDVVAESAAFVYPVPNAYTFGERNRKIVMHIPTYYFQSARTSSVLWHIKKPLTIVDSSVPLKNLLTNDQLIQLEGLNEIDPAIFTNVRNYVHDEVAILMPADQRFDEDEFSE